MDRLAGKLLQEGHLYTTYPPALLRMQLDGPLAPMWEGGHSSVADLWDAFASFVYLPRIENQQVLEQAVRGGPASTTWQLDGFATADAWDDNSGRYVGVTVGEDPFAVTSSTLVLKPEIALQHVEPGDEETEVAADGGEVGGPTREAVAVERVVRRFYGAVQLDPERPSRDFGRIIRRSYSTSVVLTTHGLGECARAPFLQPRLRRGIGGECLLAPLPTNCLRGIKIRHNHSQS